MPLMWGEHPYTHLLGLVPFKHVIIIKTGSE